MLSESKLKTKKHLFYTFLTIFALTALVVLLGITQAVRIKSEYLKPLSWAFLVELVGAVIIILNKINFFDDRQKEKNSEIKDQQANLNNVPAKELLKVLDNQLLSETEQSISSVLSEAACSSQEEKEKLLIKLYACEKIAYSFNQIYSAIFGSQINALRYLNPYVVSFIKITETRKFYDFAKQQYPKIYSEYNFKKWLGFLERAAFISRKKDSIMITSKGQAFLKYLIAQDLSDNKIG